MNNGITYASVERTKSGFRWQFRGSKGGAKNWRDIVDGFARIAAEVAREAGDESPLPRGGRMLGQGAPVVVSARCLRATYRRFRRSEAVREARAEGSLVIVLDEAAKRRVKRVRKGVQNAS